MYATVAVVINGNLMQRSWPACGMPACIKGCCNFVYSFRILREGSPQAGPLFSECRQHRRFARAAKQRFFETIL
jgi:hypothetical protein